MDPERYAAILEPMVREAPLVQVSGRPDELELQAHWFAGDFGRDFVTTDGRPARVVQFGVWNRESGPDFAEAAVSFDGAAPIKGAVELDCEFRDWERHGHDVNSAYDSVVLHVCFSAGRMSFFTRTSQNRSVPQVLLNPGDLRRRDERVPVAKPGRCSALLKTLPDTKTREVLIAAAKYRLQRKGAALARLREAHGDDEALFQAIAIALGYKSNKLPFAVLSQRLPIRFLLENRSEVEPLLFGISGFLNGIEPTDCDLPTRAYLREIWEVWWAKRSSFERLTLSADHWTMSGQRPVNHPHRRLAALAQCVQHWSKLRSLRDAAGPDAIRGFFDRLTHDYWDWHYTLRSSPSRKSMALVGETRVVDLLANVFLPWTILDRPAQAEPFFALRAPLSNRRVETAAVRVLGEGYTRRDWLNSVAIQQGLLQIYDDFCLQDASDCVLCRFPEQMANW